VAANKTQADLVQMSAPVCLHVGSYRSRGGEGLYALHLDPDRFSRGGVYGDAQDASWAVQSASTGLVYMVEEAEVGRIGVHRFNGSGWHRIACVATDGALPCYLALDPAERKLAVANYGSGSIAVFDIREDGLPAGPPVVHQHTGSGPLPDRQASAHAHCAVSAPDGGLYHVDLGSDQILRYSLRVDGTLDQPTVAFAAPAGSGPRHLLFHPRRPLAVLVSELASTLTIFDLTERGLRQRQHLSTLPPRFAGHNLGGHLEINRTGNRIYVSNRGHDSIAVFAWADAGDCAPVQHISSEGASPRHFRLLNSERLLAVANEESDNVVLLHVGTDGSLASTGRQVAVPGAACVFAVQVGRSNDVAV
jgi:6-phosphogluconolactonase